MFVSVLVCLFVGLSVCLFVYFSTTNFKSGFNKELKVLIEFEKLVEQ